MFETKGMIDLRWIGIMYGLKRETDDGEIWRMYGIALPGFFVGVIRPGEEEEEKASLGEWNDNAPEHGRRYEGDL